MKTCPHQILQELILNMNFTKYELARFIQSHSCHITTALTASPEHILKFFRQEQIERITRIYQQIYLFNLSKGGA